MKNFLTLNIIFFFISMSCTKPKTKWKTATYIFEIKNECSLNTEILLYHPLGPVIMHDSLFLSTIVHAGDSVIVDSGSLLPPPLGPTYHLTSGLDSALFIFADGKKLLFSRRNNEHQTHSVLIDENYTATQNDSFVKMQYTITEEDYLRAE